MPVVGSYLPGIRVGGGGQPPRRGSQEAQPPALDKIVTDSVYIIYILPAISLVPVMPSSAIRAKRVGNH